MDAVILAWHADPSLNYRLLDIGAGCGIISLILARRFSGIKVYGVEIQQSMACLANLNVLKNKMTDRIEVICRDLKILCPEDTGGTLDMVITNPPFGKAGCTRVGPDRSKNAATHEIYATLADVLACSKRMLKVFGTLIIIYPAQRLPELFYELRAAQLEPKWLRMVHPFVTQNANRVIVKAVKRGSQGLTIGSPLYVHQADRSYTPEIERMFRL
ncbi:MAG: methyltransferase [Desulfobacterales bacterium]